MSTSIATAVFCELCGCSAARHRDNSMWVACRTFGCSCPHYWPGG